MAIRTKAEIARDMKAWLEARLRSVDTGSATALSALILEGYALVLAQAYTDLGTAQTAQGISDPTSVDKFDLDDVAYNLSLTRKAAAKAKGFVTFRRSTAPTATIRIGSEDGTGNVFVSTSRDSSGGVVQFVTTQTVYFTTSTARNPVSNLYEVSAPITAVQPGESGNKDAGTIVTPISAVSGVTSITNKTSTTGGKNEETNAELAMRMISRILGLQPGVEEGLRSVAMGVDGVEDASVVGPDDTEFQRSGIGDVDLVIKGSADTTSVDQFVYSGPTAHTLDNRPATDIATVVSTVGLTQVALTEDSQWSFSQDTVSEERNSENSNDHLSWLGSDLPVSGSDVIVTYTYNRLVKDVQDIVDLDSKHYPAADVLVKQATAVTIDMTFTVRRNSSTDSTVLRNLISTALTDYISSLGLGETITQSKVLAQIRDVSGVAHVTTPFTKLARRGSSGVSDVDLTKYEYPQLDDQSLTITITTT